MRISRDVKPHEKVFVCICVALLLVLTACQSNSSQVSNNPILQIPAQIQDGSPSANSSPGGLQISPHNGQHATPTNGTTSSYNSGASPGPVPTGNGPIPAAFPRYFSFGVMSPPATASALDGMRSNNGAAFTFRYQYLTGGANTGRGWETWQQPTGQFATYYMQESDQHSYMPTFVYYELCLTNGPHPSDYCGGHNVDQDTGNLSSPSAMNAYFGNWVLMLQEIRAYGKPVLVIVEPDLWGFLQNATNGTDNAASVPASVSSSGFADAAGFPNNAQGFAWALLHMRDKYAPNAILTLHASTWASGNDIATSTDAGLDVAGMARQEATFLKSAGLVGNPPGVSTWDLISSDVADFDSAQPNGRSWWDRYNRTFPNFARYLTFIGDISQQTHRRVVMWQVPMGNQYFDTMNNTPGHYQDNRAEYILGNVPSFATAGVIAVLFGPGNGGTMNIDAMHDGVTNPAPIVSYECNLCNSHVSSYPDDDGGFLRIFVGMYMQHPVAIS
jgi:hypothetical protein